MEAAKKPAEKGSRLDYALRLFGLGLIVKSTIARINKVSKVLNSSVPAEVFLQGIATGFDQGLKKKPSPSSASNAQGLANIQISLASKLKEEDDNLKKDIKAACQARLNRFKDLDNIISKGTVNTHEDFLEYPNEEFATIEWRLRNLIKTDETLNYLIEGIDQTYATFSALASHTLVNIDAYGVQIGEMLADYSVNYLLGEELSQGVNDYVIKQSLILAFIFQEATGMASEFTDFSFTTFLYPIITGIYAGLYDDVIKEEPQLVQNVKKAIPDEPFSYYGQFINFVAKCHESARKNYYELYDKRLLGKGVDDQDPYKGIEGTIRKNATYSKGLLTARKLCLEYLDEEKPLKERMFSLRALLMTAQNVTSISIFNITKWVTSKASNYFYSHKSVPDSKPQEEVKVKSQSEQLIDALDKGMPEKEPENPRVFGQK